MKRHLERETTKLYDVINRSNVSTKKELAEMKKVTEDQINEMKKDTAEKQKDTADKINEMKEILSAVLKDQIAAINAKNVQANEKKVI